MDYVIFASHGERREFKDSPITGTNLISTFEMGVLVVVYSSILVIPSIVREGR